MSCFQTRSLGRPEVNCLRQWSLSWLFLVLSSIKCSNAWIKDRYANGLPSNREISLAANLDKFCCETMSSAMSFCLRITTSKLSCALWQTGNLKFGQMSEGPPALVGHLGPLTNQRAAPRPLLLAPFQMSLRSRTKIHSQICLISSNLSVLAM